MATTPPSPRPSRAEILQTCLLGRLLTPWLRRLYADFQGDLTLALVLGEIGQQNVSQQLRPYQGDDWPLPERLQAPAEALRFQDLRPCNAHSIAIATGIPRETVRRKVAKLKEWEWISEDARGHLYVTDLPANVFLDFNRRMASEVQAAAGPLERLRQAAAVGEVGGENEEDEEGEPPGR